MSDMSVGIPTHQLADGRLFITDHDCKEFPWVREFVGRFPNFWARDDIRDGWVSPIDQYPATPSPSTDGGTA